MELTKENIFKGAIVLVAVLAVLSFIPSNDSNGITVAHDGDAIQSMLEDEFVVNYNEASEQYDDIVIRAEAGEFDDGYEEYQAFDEAYDNWDDYASPAMSAYINSNDSAFIDGNEWRYENLIEQRKDMLDMEFEYFTFPEDL